MERKAKARSKETKESISQTKRLSPVDKIFLGEQVPGKGKYDEKEFVTEVDAVSYYTRKRPVSVNTSAPQDPAFFSVLETEEKEEAVEEAVETPAPQKAEITERPHPTKPDEKSEVEKKALSDTDKRTFRLIISLLVTFILIVLLIIAFIIFK